MNSISLLFVHTGASKPPQCMIESIAIAYRVATCKIYALVNHEHASFLDGEIKQRTGGHLERLEFISIENIPPSDVSKGFATSAKIDRDFRDGFWFATSNRFFLLADFMQYRQLENCLHLENDVVLFFDPTLKLEAFRSFAKFAIPFDRTRAIPGIVWYKDAQFALQVSAYIAQHSEKPDFDVLREFCDAHPSEAKPLPTMPKGYARGHHLSLDNYCQGIDAFGGIFDAAAIGQYLGGVHWMNDPEDSRFFINESSQLDMEKCQFYWARQSKYRYPILSYNNDIVPILNLHAHSKDSLGVSPFNCVDLQSSDNVITGERLQSLAQLTISSQVVTQFHGRENIHTPQFLEIPSKETRKFFKKKIEEIAPDAKFIRTCQGVNSIFIYTHLLPYFKKYIAPRLYQPFTLLTHNSDHGISIDDLGLLNQPELKVWLAQNAEFSHEKLKGLPIGLTNSQWGADRLGAVFHQSMVWEKTKLLYANFREDTHPSRVDALESVKNIASVTRGEKVDFTTFIQDLAAHKFCLCPRGNGIDTHRFWEAQYLDCIPIIVKQDWISAYSNLPVLILDSWHDLYSIDLNAVYVKISCTQYDRSVLYFSNYVNFL